LTKLGEVQFTKIRGSYDYRFPYFAHKVSFTFRGRLSRHLKIGDKIKIAANKEFVNVDKRLSDTVLFIQSRNTAVTYLNCNIYGGKISEVVEEIVDDIGNILKATIEMMYFGTKIYSYKQKITINHIGKVNHPVSKLFRKYGITYNSSNLVIDASGGEIHLEFVNRKTNFLDLDIIEGYDYFMDQGINPLEKIEELEKKIEVLENGRTNGNKL